MQEWHACGTLISITERASAYDEWARTRLADFGERVQQRLLVGALVSGVDYVQAVRRRRELRAELQAAMRDLDVVMTAGNPARGAEDRRHPEVGRSQKPSFTMPFNVAGYPAMCVCSGFGRRRSAGHRSRSSASRSRKPRCCASPTRSRRPRRSAIAAPRCHPPSSPPEGKHNGPASASRLAADRPHRRVRRDLSTGDDDRVRRHRRGAVRLGPARGDAAGQRRTDRAAGTVMPSSPPIPACAPVISSPARSPSPARNRATCWRSASRRSCRVPTGATT